MFDDIFGFRHLTDHQRIPTIEKPYECDLCQKYLLESIKFEISKSSH